MKNIIKKEKGITMVALVITVIILLILTNVLIYNARDMVYVKNLTGLYNDIGLLREKIAEYYNEYGELPAKTEYTNTNRLSGILSRNNDTGKFYVIDLEAMNGITLNYGKDYEKIKSDSTNVNSYTDLYIINENSHNIFYVQGINVEENGIITTYYTDYIEPDETTVDLRSVDGILIPDGYYYIGKYKDSSGNESIVISSNKNEEINDTSTTQYIWQKQVSKIDNVPDSVNLKEDQDEAEFLKSVNAYQGYFKNKNKTTDIDVVFNIVNEDKWSETYTKDSEFTDIYGDTVTIPEGFRISMAPTMNVIKNGLVIKDQNDNQWVWIEVPKTIYKRAMNSTDYDNIKADLIDYAEDYRKGSSTQEHQWEDEWYDGCGLTQEEYEEYYNKMLSSIFENEGFWIGRYEVGDSVATTNNTTRTSTTGITNKAVIQANQIPYNYVTVEQAQELSEGFATAGKTTSLIFGIQWDLVCKFIEENSDLTYYDIATDSTEYGNYTNSSILLSRGKYNTSSNNASSVWTSVTKGIKNGDILLTTGASEDTRVMNIYDFAGNVREWTLEHANENQYRLSSYRGGDYDDLGSEYSMANRDYNYTTEGFNSFGFRATLY